LSIELFLWLDSLPGSTKDVVRKTSSYAVQVNSSGRVLFVLTNGASSITLTSNTSLTTGRWYHIVCVYNGNYAGVQRFGKSSIGSSNTQVDDDNGNNNAVSRFTLLETGILNRVSASLEYVDEIWPVEMCAVVYSSSGGEPASLVTSSPVSILNPPTPAHRNWTWVPFTLSPALVPAGDYYLGIVSDTVAGPLAKAVLVIGSEPSGGFTRKRSDSVSSPSAVFGTSAVSNSSQLAVYCDYTAVGRTGNEGRALIYIDGTLNVSGAYTAGIADNTNALEVTPAMSARVDELSIWNKALTSVQVATHYTAH
jgi:hypothetical protein